MHPYLKRGMDAIANTVLAPAVYIQAILTSSSSNDYTALNNFSAAPVFNENLLYLSPILKKEYFY